MVKGRVRSAVSCALLLMLISCAPASQGESAGLPGPVSEGASPPAAKPLIPIKAGVFSFITYAPLYFAVQEGYFAEEGLDVELVNLGSAATADAIIALASGELDVAGFTMSTGVFNAIIGGRQLKYVADKGYIDPEACPTNAWVASPATLQSGLLADPQQIRGKTVVVTRGDVLEYSLDIMLAQLGLTQADITITGIADSPARIEALKAGAIDVSVLSEPWITRAKKAGAAEVWMSFAEFIPGESLGTLIYGPRLLEEEPETGTRFMVGYLRGVEQYNQGKTDRNVELLAEFTKLSPEDIRESCWSSFQPDGRIELKGMLAFQQWAVDKGYVDELLDPESFWTSQFVDEAAAELSR